MLVGCLQWYVIDIINSHFVTIKNVMFKHCSIPPDNKTQLTNLKLSCCFSCKIQNVTFMQYGLTGFNLIGDSYLYNIKIQSMEFSNSQLCCQIILLQYTNCLTWNNYSTYMHHVSIEQISIYNYTKYKSNSNTGLYINMDYTTYHLKLFLKNSYFCNMDRRALFIKGRNSLTTKQIFVTNCKFISIGAPAIKISLSPFNKTINFINCEFFNNTELIIIEIAVCRDGLHTCELVISDVTFTLILTNISFVRCQFINNRHWLLIIENKAPPTLDKGNVLLKSLTILHNIPPIAARRNNMISIATMNVHISGTFNVTKNRYRFSIMKFQSCDVLLSGKIVFNKNKCGQVILLDTYITIMEFTNITFKNNGYYNNIISIEGAEEYYQPYPFCIFQYIAMHNNVTPNDLLSHYFVSFTHNYKLLHHYHVINLNGTTLHSQNNIPSISFCHFTSHCKWLHSGAFYGYNPETVNQKIVKTDDKNCNNHKQICYCSQSKKVNCSIDILGTIYPGQTLKTNLCNMYSNDDNTILYAEVHNINLPSSACKIAHQFQLINVIGNHSNTVNYTIVTTTPDNDRCVLFLTAPPFLNEIYNTFYVQLLPCPIGFTLQDGVCDCDPILPPNFDKCSIDHSVIRRPANTWITAHSQANNTAYLISDCTMDYCIPYTSTVNLLYPDLQCQFNRTGILCSQCQHHLSMVFGSSRCMKCANVHILIITVIVIVAGIVLVVLLYFLNLTVTIGTINGIIFYANVVSINNSVFLVNDNVFKLLRVFISFVNLDLGIETCFYNGMDGYIKTCLQLFFPLYLIIIAVSIIIASRYSSRILRLTYTRSLPACTSYIVPIILHWCSQNCINSLVLLFYHNSSTKWSSTDSLVY